MPYKTTTLHIKPVVRKDASVRMYGSPILLTGTKPFSAVAAAQVWGCYENIMQIKNDSGYFFPVDMLYIRENVLPECGFTPTHVEIMLWGGSLHVYVCGADNCGLHAYAVDMDAYRKNIGAVLANKAAFYQPSYGQWEPSHFGRQRLCCDLLVLTNKTPWVCDRTYVPYNEGAGAYLRLASTPGVIVSNGVLAFNQDYEYFNCCG